ncbi:hypothetical protein NDU88_008784 [Pleurodeles waltl]|uniref:Uncharacterized protein n=1 Tax=Pleurodeles waltl TaxID=8319 RepID=A0AAV7NZY3_PLEWA|nr:hypothetical protein NDU88_008784 [Pleurodeles waltl]
MASVAQAGPGKNDNANDHGVDEDGEPDECLARDGEKRAAGSNVEGTELTLVGPLGFVPVDEVVKVVEEQICGNLCSMPKSQLSVSGSPRLSWDCQVQKAAIALKQAAGEILRFKHKAGGRSVSIILEIYARKAVAAALYGAELWGFMNVRVLQVAENNFLRTLLELGPGTPLKALYAELNWTLISELAAIRPILYWARVVRNPRAEVYLETLEEVISYDGPGGCSWGAYVKKTLENLRLKELWVDPGRVTKDTVGQIKDRYWEVSRTRVYQELRPDSITHYYFNNVYDPAPQAYLDMLHPELKRTHYMKYRLGVLPLRGYLVRTHRLTEGLEFCDCTLGRWIMWLISTSPVRNLMRQSVSGFFLFLRLVE